MAEHKDHVIINLSTDLPEIPGVPPDLTPKLVEALKSTTKFFSKSDKPFSLEPPNEEHSTASQQSLSVVDSILNRMECSAEEKARTRRLERMQRDCQSWLDAVKRRAPESHRGSSVPLACFRYLWGLGQEHGRVAVRRASLNLCGTLLLKSCECRMHVSSDDTLLKWVTCVVDAKDVKASLEIQVSLLASRSSRVVDSSIGHVWRNVSQTLCCTTISSTTMYSFHRFSNDTREQWC